MVQTALVTCQMKKDFTVPTCLFMQSKTLTRPANHMRRIHVERQLEISRAMSDAPGKKEAKFNRWQEIPPGGALLLYLQRRCTCVVRIAKVQKSVLMKVWTHQKKFKAGCGVNFAAPSGNRYNDLAQFNRMSSQVVWKILIL